MPTEWTFTVYFPGAAEQFGTATGKYGKPVRCGKFTMGNTWFGAVRCKQMTF